MADRVKIPEDRAAIERQLAELRRDLLRLHKALVDAERAAYDRAHGRVTPAGEMLRLLIEHPWFLWLRPLSALIVRIDEVRDADEPVTAEDLRAVLDETRALIAPAEGTPGLGERYRATLQAEPAVAMAHGAVTRRLGPDVHKRGQVSPLPEPHDNNET